MKDRLPALAESLSVCCSHPLIQQTVQRRAAMAALSMQGIDHRTIALFTHVHHRTVHRWIRRLEEGRLFTDQPRCGRPRRFGEAARLTTIAVYCQQAPPLPGVHNWSLRDAHSYFSRHHDILGTTISRATIHRILLEHALRPHRRRYYLQVTDPDFFPKMDHLIPLYLKPPRNLFCFDECTCIQALRRLTPDLPAATHRPRCEDFDYQRNGTTDLLAFLNPATGAVSGQCVPNHNRHTLCRVFTDQVNTLPADEDIHYIMDNLSTHYHDDFCQTVAQLSGVEYTPLKTAAWRRQWLQSDHKRIVVHFTPFHASWLNMVEIWFGILNRKCLNYGHFASVQQLCEEILAFIDTWNNCYAHPFSWAYTGEGLHPKALRRFCRLLALQTDQMDPKFLTSQLLLMSNLADNYTELIPAADWRQLLQLATDNDAYITNIIDTDTKPRRQKKARQAYDQFRHTVLQRNPSLSQAA
jgi:transposase